MRSLPLFCTRLAGAALMLALAGCQSAFDVPQFNTPKFDTAIFVPNPTQFARREAALNPVTSADLVDAAGNCAGGGTAPEGAGAFSSPRGIALQMTECDVVRAAGTPAEVQIGATERGERQVTMTYPAADRPIYRFIDGRLTLIERGAEPPPEPVKKKPAPKRQKQTT